MSLEGVSGRELHEAEHGGTSERVHSLARSLCRGQQCRRSGDSRLDTPEMCIEQGAGELQLGLVDAGLVCEQRGRLQVLSGSCELSGKRLEERKVVPGDRHAGLVSPLEGMV